MQKYEIKSTHMVHFFNTCTSTTVIDMHFFRLHGSYNASYSIPLRPNSIFYRMILVAVPGNYWVGFTATITHITKITLCRRCCSHRKFLLCQKRLRRIYMLNAIRMEKHVNLNIRDMPKIYNPWDVFRCTFSSMFFFLPFFPFET